MFKIQQNLNTPFIGASYASWYIYYDQEKKELEIDGATVSSAVAYDIIVCLKKQLQQPPERGYHYDISKIGDDVVRIGIAGHNISIMAADLPLLKP